MADLSVTAGSVVSYGGAGTDWGTAGATITAGQSLYIDTADSNKLKLTDASVAATAVFAGISLCGAGNNQPIKYQKSGAINPGATVVVGMVYVVSTTAGGICPLADLVTGEYVSIIGVGLSSSKIDLLPYNSAVAKP